MFTQQTRNQLAAKNIDIEESYRLLLLEIRMGGPVCQRIEMALMGHTYVNTHHPEGRNITDHHGSTTDRLPAAVTRQPKTNRLSPAELRALSAVADHGSVRVAAKTIGLSFHTVTCQVNSARQKLDARNLTHTVAQAIRQGLIA